MLRSYLTGAVMAAGFAMATTVPGVAQEPVTLDVYYAYPSFAKFHEGLAKEFLKDRTDIKIEFRAPAPSYDEGHQGMVRASITNTLPDVYYAGLQLLPELSEVLKARNHIMDLGKLMDSEPATWRKENYAENVLELGQVDGIQYGLPFNASMPIMFYNADLVKQAGGDPDNMPTTWPELTALAEKIHALNEGITGIQYDIQGWPDDWLWDAMFMQAGVMPIVDGKINFDEKLGLEALRLYRKFVTDSGMQLVDWDQSRQAFIAGKVGILFDTPARVNQVTELIGDRFKVRTGLFPMDNKEKGGLPTGGNAVVITAQDEAKQKAAWEFVKFVTSPKAQEIVVKMSGYLPTNVAATGPDYLAPFYEANPNFRTVADQMNRSKPWPIYPGGNTVKIWRVQRDIITGVMRGDMTPEDGLAKIIEQTQALMK